MLALVAMISGLLLTSRLMATRLVGTSSSDNASAREAAEYGLNEIQAQLNTNQFGHLWVTKLRKDDNSLRWGTLTRQKLADCRIGSFSSSGTVLEPTTIPDGIKAAKTIKSDTSGTISYQLTDFEPPKLPDSNSTTLDQPEYCGTNTTSARNFGNLSGGSAVITVTGTITRSGKSFNYTMRRQVLVDQPGNQLAYSFMILGDAYDDTKNGGDSYGAATDIAKLNYFDGNVCYVDASTNISNDTCFAPKTLTRTTIGCYDLGACLVNNIDSVNKSKRTKYCADVKVKKKKKRGTTCNDFQQSGILPNAPTPTSEGFLNTSGTPYSSSDWSTFASQIECSIKEKPVNDSADCKATAPTSQASKESHFPYYNLTSPPTLAQVNAMKNSQLVKGCYFNNVTSADATVKSSGTTAINCLISTAKISGAGGKDPNLIVYTTTAVGSTTSLLPVNIFLYGSASTPITLSAGGIANSDTSADGWKKLRIFGKSVTPPSGSAVSCAQSSGITSTKGNDLNGMFIWLPNASLTYQRQASKDNAYMVIWVCKFTGPIKDSNNNPYSILTPLPESVVRAGLTETLGAAFTTASGSTYRGFGATDSPAP